MLQQVAHIDAATYNKQRALLQKGDKQAHSGFVTYENSIEGGNEADRKLGLQLLEEGKVAALIVAGGQGTRLGFDGPKGAFPVTPVKKKTLFQLFAEKTVAASKMAGRALPLAIMTSPHNHEKTLAFFKGHGDFGLEPGQAAFFSQSFLPFLNESGNLFLEDKSRVAMGPDGNGAALHILAASGLAHRWRAAGIEFIQFLFVDNPLADPYDLELAGACCRLGDDIAVKCVDRGAADEKVGLIVSHQGRLRVVEYTEFPLQEWTALREDGTLRHRLANIGRYCFSLSFIERLVKEAPLGTLPLHLAKKKAPVASRSGMPDWPLEPNSWKFERYIFDVFPYAQRTHALVSPREECYAPLKNSSGEHSIDSVQRALQFRDKQIFSIITGRAPEERTFELAQQFYYPSPALTAKWKGQSLPQTTYIEP